MAVRTLQCEPEVTRVLRCHCRRCSAHARNRSHFHDSCREVLLRLHMRRRELPTWTKQHRPSTSADQRAKQPSMDKLAIATRATSVQHARVAIATHYHRTASPTYLQAPTSTATSAPTKFDAVKGFKATFCDRHRVLCPLADARSWALGEPPPKIWGPRRRGATELRV